jgi:roadblock/LC7 domain-containing protein
LKACQYDGIDEYGDTYGVFVELDEALLNEVLNGEES